MSNIGIFDTSISTDNIGDFIIMDSVRKELRKIYGVEYFHNFGTHNYLSFRAKKKLRDIKIIFVGGTNLLSSNMLVYSQWKISLFDINYVKDAILLGVGWWQYQNEPTFYTKYLLKSVLNKNFIHSVRDDYSVYKLNMMGINNVINTSCPSMWDLGSEHCSQIPTQRAESVIFTITDYKPNKLIDKQFIDLLLNEYKNVFCFLQGANDLKYLKEIYSGNRIKLIPPDLKAYNDKLISGEVDYIGTRLHAGIRSLQKKVRSLIIAVDNRAWEQKGTGLNVCEREDFEHIKRFIHGDYITKITLPMNAIKKWRGQFY